MRKSFKPVRFFRILSLLILILGVLSQIAEARTKIASPEEFFGFKLGSDKKIARWDRIVDYFKHLEKESEKLRVIDMGPSTMGHPFLWVIISSPENLANLDRLKEINAKISDPRGIEEEDIRNWSTKARRLSASP